MFRPIDVVLADQLAELGSQGGDDLAGNVVLDRENVGQLAVVALGPQMAAGLGVDQLGGDAHPLAAFADAAFDNVSDPEVAADTEAKAVDTPGTYVLQAGSFTTLEDADRRRAQLALQGIESAIQRVTIDDKTYHRVRIGPIDDLDELNMIRSRLRAAKIDVLIIRLRA